MKLLEQINPAQLPNTPIRLAFFDLDGTLVNAAGYISGSTRHAIKELQQSDVFTALASGRPYFGCRTEAEALQITAPSLFYSGALIITPGTEEVLFESSIDPLELGPLLEAVRRESLYCELYTRNAYFAEARSSLADDHFEYLKCYPHLRNLQEVIEKEHILKVVLVSDTPEREEKIRSLASKFPSLHFAYSKGAAHPHILFGNITNPKASRETGFQIITSKLQVNPHQVIAFGDADADIPFLKLAGYGIAMANASPAVQREAKFVTKSVEEDGVAFALDMLRTRWEKPGRKSL